MEKRREAFRLAVTRRGELLRCGVSPDRATGLDPHVVARSPDRATGLDRRSPKRCRSGDLRSRTVAGSGDPATTDLPSAGARVVARSPDRATGLDRRSPKRCRSGDLRSRTVAGSGDPATTGPSALAGLDRRSPKRCRSGDLRSRTVAGSGDPATTEPQQTTALWPGLRTGPLAWTEGHWLGPKVSQAVPERRPSVADRGGVQRPRHNRPPRCGPVSGPGHWLGPKVSQAVPERRPSVADRGGVRRPRHNGVSLRRSEANQSSPLMRLAPLSTMRIGRPMGVLFCFFQFTPSTSQTVAKKSSAETLPSTTFAPSGSVLPMTCPPLMPPPIMTVLQARG